MEALIGLTIVIVFILGVFTGAIYTVVTNAGYPSDGGKHYRIRNCYQKLVEWCIQAILCLLILGVITGS